MKKRVMINMGQSEQDVNTLLLLHFDGNYRDYSRYKRIPLSSNLIYYKSAKFNNGLYVPSNSSVISYSPNFFKSVINSKVYTIDLWLKIGPFSSSNKWGFVLGVDDATLNGFVLRYNNDIVNTGIEYGLLYNNKGSIFNQIPYPKDSNFHHLAISSNGYNTMLFIDGNLIAKTGSPSISFPSSNFTVGGREIGTGEASNSIIDELRISNIARWTSNFTPPSKPY